MNIIWVADLPPSLALIPPLPYWKGDGDHKEEKSPQKQKGSRMQTHPLGLPPLDKLKEPTNKQIEP